MATDPRNMTDAMKRILFNTEASEQRQIDFWRWPLTLPHGHHQMFLRVP